MTGFNNDIVSISSDCNFINNNKLCFLTPSITNRNLLC